ncbi:MAG TPA: FAD-dependent oxidoreductase [Solirubrobacterales bacterium]|jgi:glycine/D-amino acid oxidase-like deaminating enzyme|nr:FAD-dependent oxidoreductase [Solirubrobacterales bacterium]
MRHTRLGYWIEEAGTAEPRPPLAGEHEADVLVVGGGYTGMWTAWYARQLQPEARIVLLEAEEVCGRGPSGRNGGFCNALWFSLASMRDRWGAEGALATAHAAQAAVDRIERFCEEHEVDAWVRPAGYVQVSTAPAHDCSWLDAVEACRELGVPEMLRPLSRHEVAARCKSPAFRGGVVSPTSATVQPARLALGLREQLIGAGVEIFESSPVRSFREAGDGIEVRTDAGSVRSARGVLAIGSAAKARRGPLRDRLTVASSHIALTEPVPDVLEELGWTGGECITDSRALVHYFRTTNDGRIAFGWGGGRIAMGARTKGRAEVDAAVIAAVAAHLHEYFPALRGRRLTHAWGGPIDASPTHLPAVTTLGQGRAFVAAGYTGNGVGPSDMVGRTLASLALDRDDDHTRLAFVDAKTPRVPPEPFHWIGGEAIRLAIEKKEEAEMGGAQPGRVASAVARVPELIGFHIGR